MIMLERPKVPRTFGVFTILTLKCASRYSGVHFFNSWTSKSGSRLVCFVFFLTLLHIFWLLHVLRSKATSIFSTSRLTKVFRTCSVCNMLTSKCASHHNGVYFLTAQLPKVLQRHAFFSTSHSPEVLQTWGVFHILTSKSASHDSCVIFLISHATRWLRTQQADFSPFRSVSRLFYLFYPFLSLVSLSLLWLLSPLLLHLSISRKFDFQMENCLFRCSFRFVFFLRFLVPSFSAFLLSLLLCFFASLLFPAGPLLCFSAFLCFPAFLLLWFLLFSCSAFLLLCFFASLLLWFSAFPCFSAFPASLLSAFPCLPAFLLLCFSLFFFPLKL